ncbi:enoyl-CoA hydratase/isomerase family protein [Paralcaligenes ureilyticus]|uniref:Enoyl-CoA hydratase/carnithine racemase n=1 Tax=Paralcaligenes ureilyticus TaxID=627131 RepID=A0A4R3LPK5_9BURK|nr:enoyl-CoA hydratase/isomerase family protein [Paralcaligenes ureilyticus]TCT02312.1 enoyl-CoA hydratase/carnithine racemase [Paralcaligenes ureilyticus]
MNDELLINKDGPCWTLTLNRPNKMNALSASVVESLIAAVDAAPQQHAQILVIRGAGKTLSAGFDFTDVHAQSEGDIVLRFLRIEMLLQKVASSPCLTVGLAHGRIFGAGADLFAACRKRIATPDSSFRMPGLHFGVVLGTRRFAAIVGNDAASEILTSTRVFDAAEAKRLGFCHALSAMTSWDSIIQEATATAQCLPDSSRRTLFELTKANNNDSDLADLARSVAAPGLIARIQQFREKK